MKKTALYNIHTSLGAKMVPFAGFNMPIQYNGVISEHLCVRNNVGVFDVSHMGEFFVRGHGAKDFIQNITSNDVNKLFDGKVQYSCLPNLKGGIVDDLLVYRIKKDIFMLVVNASNIEKDWEWIKKFKTKNVELENKSDDISLLAVQGPMAIEVLQPLTKINLKNMPYYCFEKGVFASVENVLISSTGYTGSGGFEIYFANEFAEKIWDSIFNIGKKYNIQPIGLAARDTLRLEMGFCLYGNDINDSTSPIEAGLSWITKFNNKFNNSDFLQKQLKNGVSKKLVGFELLDRGIPRKDYEITDFDGNSIGIVTSGSHSPSLNKPIGLAYVNTSYSNAESIIYVKVRKKLLKAKVVKLPFYKNA
tara:strand:- start:349 stop:1434 length:1086 start_codon:yes stop_codon:yes gene_type:complete